jgi:hypothetical protein
MSIIRSGNSAHDTTASTAEMTRQVADDKARASLTDTALQAALNANAVTYFRSVIASGVANGIEVSTFREGLHRLTGSYS